MTERAADDIDQTPSKILTALTGLAAAVARVEERQVSLLRSTEKQDAVVNSLQAHLGTVESAVQLLGRDVRELQAAPPMFDKHEERQLKTVAAERAMKEAGAEEGQHMWRTTIISISVTFAAVAVFEPIVTALLAKLGGQ